MKTKLSSLLMAGVLSFPLVLASCSDDVDVAGTGVSTDSGVESAFDFSSTADLTVSISYPAFTTVDVYDKIPDGENGAQLLYHTVTGGNGNFEDVVTLPSKYIGKKVYAIATGAGCPAVTELVVTNEGIKISSKASKSVIPSSSDYDAKEINILVGRVLAALHDGEDNYDLVTKKYNYSDNIDMSLVKDADQIKVTFINAQCANENSLYYYVYRDENENVNIDNFINDDYKIFDGIDQTNSSLNAGKSVLLTKGSPENDMKFKAGDRIGFILVSENFGTRNVFTTAVKYNSYGNELNEPQSARFVHENKSLIYTFEDRPLWEHELAWIWDGLFWGHHEWKWVRQAADFNDFTFMVTADPVDAIDDENIHGLPKPPFYLPVKSAPYSGVVAFEDMYPSQGDYDMNDFVAKYSLISTTYVWFNPETEEKRPPYYLGEVEYEFTPIWDGAAYGCDLNFILEVGGNRKVNHVYGHDADSYMGEINLGPITGVVDFGFETVKSDDPNIGETCSGGIELGNEPAITWSTMFNPYITVSNTNYEVHLPNMPASPDATGLEGLDEYTRAYLVEGGNFPFAVNVPSANFKVAPEKECINKYYPKYDNWVKSNGQEDSDWYDYPRE